MIYVTGDKHGRIDEFKKIKKFCLSNKTTTEDYMIILGDVGLNFTLNSEDNNKKKFLNNLPVTTLCVRGNHEERPENIKGIKEIPMFGSTVYMEEKYPNIIYLKDGEEYTINSRKYLILGGAYSVDKDYRIANKVPYFAQEQLSSEEREIIYSRVNNCSYDYVLSHTCPIEWEPQELLTKKDQSKVDSSTEYWLSTIKEHINYGKWLYGHFHGDINYDNHTLLFNNIITI